MDITMTRLMKEGKHDNDNMSLFVDSDDSNSQIPKYLWYQGIINVHL